MFYVSLHRYRDTSSFGSNGTGKGQFNSPCGVCVSSTGNIAVADYGNNRVQVFSSEGNYLREFGQEILKGPVYVAYTASSPEDIIVVDFSSYSKFESFAVHNKWDFP